MLRSSRRFVLATLVSMSALATGCVPLDGKAERAFTASEAKPSKLVIEARFVDVDLSVAEGDLVAVDAKVVLKTTGGNVTAEQEIEKVAFAVERDGDTLYIRQGKKGEKLAVSSWSGSGHLKVALPSGVPFAISNASGNVAMNGGFGKVAAAVSVASGDIDGTLGVDSLTTDAASGDTELSLAGSVAKLDCEAASGDITVKAPSIASCTASAASGNITIEGLTGPFQGSAASGNIHVVFVDFPASATTTAEAASGNVSIVLPAGAAPSGRVSTASGSVDLNVPAKVGKKSAELTGTGAAIKASAASGNVSIKTRSK
jgi:DUF4097 and DUF4098 domain-containing protein YvlB